MKLKSIIVNEEGFAFGDGGKEGLAVRFVDDAAVEDDNDAGIGFGADEAAETLLEFYDCGRQLIIVEGVAAVFFNLLYAPCDKRAIRNSEG